MCDGNGRCLPHMQMFEVVETYHRICLDWTFKKKKMFVCAFNIFCGLFAWTTITPLIISCLTLPEELLCHTVHAAACRAEVSHWFTDRKAVGTHWDLVSHWSGSRHLGHYMVGSNEFSLSAVWEQTCHFTARPLSCEWKTLISGQTETLSLNHILCLSVHTRHVVTAIFSQVSQGWSLNLRIWNTYQTYYTVVLFH